MKKLFYPVVLFLCTFSSLIALNSCDSGDTGNAGATTQDTSQANLAQTNSIKKILYSIPAPMQMASLIKETGAKYDKAMLNNTENSKSYAGEIKQAINLGIYGADLSYASIFDQKQESMNFLAAAQKLSRQLGVDGALRDDIVERMNANMENRDSLLNIVSQSYADLYDYLKENKREEVSALVIAGGWVEALYLATVHAGKSADIRQRVAEQKYSLTDLIALMNQYGEKESLTGVKADLAELQTLFAEVQVTKSNTSTSKGSDGVVVIGGGSAVTISDETLAKVTTKVKELRTKYITL
ncbi:MAG: hypothetical protein RL220_1339 [Bacteroidota bacterium]